MLSQEDLRCKAADLVRSIPFAEEASLQVLSTLLDAGFTIEELGKAKDDLSNVLGRGRLKRKASEEASLNSLAQNGSHDTNSRILHLYLRSQIGEANFADIIAATGPRSINTAPFDVQCDALRLLLAAPVDMPRQANRIFELLEIICESWWQGEVVCSQGCPMSYARIAFARAFATLCLYIHRGQLDVPEEFAALMGQRAPIVLTQVAAQILVAPPTKSPQVQTGKGKEFEPAYSIQTLHAVAAFPFVDILQNDIQAEVQSLQSALSIILENETFLPPPVLASILAALRQSSWPRLPQDQAAAAHNAAKTEKLISFATYFANADFMNSETLVSVKASILEASFYTSLLQASRNDIFPATSARERDKYLNYIPPMFTFQSTYYEGCTPPQWLHDIMLWSMFIFLCDEYMERVVTQFSEEELLVFQAGLERIHPNPDPSQSVISIPQLSHTESLTVSTAAEDNNTEKQDEMKLETGRVESALEVYYSWLRWVFNWPRLSLSTPSDMSELRSELKKYLLFHLHQIQDNIRFAKQLSRSLSNPESSENLRLLPFQNPRTSYATWLHTVGGGHISAPMSLAFAACYMGSWVRKGKNGWSSVMQGVLAYELNIHVAAYCRMYNDYGSLSRDLTECNLNSVNFPEFWIGMPQHCGFSGESCKRNTDEEIEVRRQIKATLLEVAKHERVMADHLAEKFYKSLEDEKTEEGRRIASALRVYFRSGELFSDMYLTRDVTNSVK